MIDSIIEQRAQGVPALVSTTRTKLILKGINPDKFTASSDDDPVVMEKLRALAQELGLSL